MPWGPWRTFCKTLQIRAFPFRLIGHWCSLLTRPCLSETSWSVSMVTDCHVCHIRVQAIPCWYFKQSLLAMPMVGVHSVAAQNAASLTLMTATPAPSPASASQRLGPDSATSVLQSISNSTPKGHTITTHLNYVAFMCELVRFMGSSLLWRHNGRDGILNHQLHDCLFNRLFRRRSKKHQSTASLAFVRGSHRGPVNSPHKWPVTRKMFPFDNVIMFASRIIILPNRRIIQLRAYIYMKLRLTNYLNVLHGCENWLLMKWMYFIQALLALMV